MNSVVVDVVVAGRNPPIVQQQQQSPPFFLLLSRYLNKPRRISNPIWPPMAPASPSTTGSSLKPRPRRTRTANNNHPSTPKENKNQRSVSFFPVLMSQQNKNKINNNNKLSKMTRRIEKGNGKTNDDETESAPSTALRAHR